MTLLTDLAAFTHEHDRCGELDGAVEEVRVGEWRVDDVHVWGGDFPAS